MKLKFFTNKCKKCCGLKSHCQDFSVKIGVNVCLATCVSCLIVCSWCSPAQDNQAYIMDGCFQEQFKRGECRSRPDLLRQLAP